MIALVITTAQWILAPEASYGSYLIRLKNGREFITSRYWHEGGQIKFDTYGGVFGVDKNFVSKIEKSEKTVTFDAPKKPTPDTETQPEKFEAKTTEKEDGETAKSSKPIEATEAIREEDPVVREFDALREKFATRDGMLTKELNQLIEELSDFRKKLLNTGKVTTYIKEFTEATNMGNTTEVLLKSRGQ